MEGLPEGAWDKGSYDYNLSPADRWSPTEDYSGLKRDDQGLLLTERRKLGTTVTAIIRVLRWHHMKLFMVGRDIHHLVGHKWGERHYITISGSRQVEQIDMLKFGLRKSMIVIIVMQIKAVRK